MKKITILLALLFVSVALYAEKITLQTGDFFGISNTDYFYFHIKNPNGSLEFLYEKYSIERIPVVSVEEGESND